MLSIRLGGVDTRTIGPFGYIGDVEVNWTRATNGGGLNYVKWSMPLPRGYWHQAFATGTLVEVFRGDQKLGAATLTQPDRTGDTWKFAADGLFKRAFEFYPVVSEPAEGNLDTAIQSAITRGLQWSADTPTTGISVDLFSAKSIGQVLTEYCESHVYKWGIDENDHLYINEDPIYYDPSVAPTWAIAPGVPLMPSSDDQFLTRVHVLYFDNPFGRDEQVYGRPSTYPMATSDLDGNLTLPGGHEITVVAQPASIGGGEATELANTIYRKYALRFAFTEGLDVWPGELTTPGGTPVDNWAAYTLLGQMGNHHGAINRLNNIAVGQTVQWVMGSVTFRPGTNSLHIASVDMDPHNDFKSIMAAILAPGGRNDNDRIY